MRYISSWTLEDEIHIHARTSNILFIIHQCINTSEKGLIYYVTITMLISARVKIKWYFHVWRYEVFARKFYWYFIYEYRLLHGKCARTVFTARVFWYKNNECENTVQNTFYAVICLFYTYWDFWTPTRFSPFTGQNKYQVMFSFRPSASTSLLQILV